MYNPSKPYTEDTIKLIQKTWDTPYVAVKNGIYPVIKKKFKGLEIDHTDGIGTKGIYHWKKKTFKYAVLDALAMNLNDLALVRATAYKLQDHITVPKEDKRLLEILKELSQECMKRKIAITGGETSFHDNSEGIDITITVSGFVKKQKENRFKTGDVLIGIESNGLHSNGFTKVRKIFNGKFRKEFVSPTYIYLDTILELDKKFTINGMMHMTGGAFTKLKGVLQGNDAIITNTHKLVPQKIFTDIYKKRVSDKDMYKTFNCGVGFIFSVPRDQATNSLKSIKGFKSDIIGEIVKGEGRVKISSYFSSAKVIF